MFSIQSMANVLAIDCGDSLVIFDVGSPMTCSHAHGLIRQWRTTRVSHVVFTHHHVDHVFGVNLYEESNQRY
jgi:glyoxylase-like metal-dependent hydrolase (beta-lactamase superfamily II)